MGLRNIFLLMGLLFTVSHLAATTSEPPRTWPQRPVTLIVPFGAGGASDQFARLLAPKLSTLIGQAVVIENVAGAGGALGVRQLVSKEPDGHVLLLGGISETVLIPLCNQSAGYKSPDLQAISILASTPLVLATRKDFPATDFEALVKLTRLSPMKYTYGSAGACSYGHLMFEALAREKGIRLLHVPYKGGNQLLVDMASGQIDLALTSLPSVLPYMKTNRIDVLGVNTTHRPSDLPKLPTLVEFAMPRIGQISLWGGVFAPRGLPSPTAKVIHAAFTETLKDEKLRAKLEELGIVLGFPGSPNPNHSQSFYENQVRHYQRLVTELAVHHCGLTC
jgi:tripartite-type tricarboxylate transporter receptor subunit TctC